MAISRLNPALVWHRVRGGARAQCLANSGFADGELSDLVRLSDVCCHIRRCDNGQGADQA